MIYTHGLRFLLLIESIPPTGYNAIYLCSVTSKRPGYASIYLRPLNCGCTTGKLPIWVSYELNYNII